MTRPKGKKYTKERMNEMNEMIKRRKDEGFTLIELMIVIAVIGILAVVLMPKMGQVKTLAKLTGVETNFRSVTNVLQGGNFTDNASVTTLLVNTFAGTNSLVNPITKASAISGVESTNGPVIVGASFYVPTTSDHAYYSGAVIVVPAITGGLGTISVYGCDDKGKAIPDLTMVITP